MCGQVDQYNFGTIHHEMGHTQYQMHYAHQPSQFRDGANPGFHEAIGDAILLAVTTPKHLQCALALDIKADLDCNDQSSGAQPVTETDVNLLFFRALSKISFLPFAYSMESWKWEVMAGKLTPQQYNDRWWEIRRENQGIFPPVDRADGGFDPAAKFHIVADVEYIRYFWSNILEFQFFQGMCVAAGEFNPIDPSSKPLYQCDFSGSKQAGERLAKMLKMGSSKPWPEALKVITDSGNLDVGPMLNYFKPAFERMDAELKEAGEVPCFGMGCEEALGVD